MDHPKILAALSLIFLVSCDMTISLTGLLGEGEALAGALTLYSDGGTIEVSGDANTHCVGDFRHSAIGKQPGGRGMLVCDDRRSGPFTFTLDNFRHGAGKGNLSGTPFTFRF